MARNLRPSLAIIALVIASLALTATAQDGWTDSRATFYDDNGQGSCQYGTDIPQYYAAWPDVQAGFDGSCGRCFEVACVPKVVTDRYGEVLDRTNVCHDTSRTVVVKVVDSCPCYHMNYASNQRWCCGDQDHLDLGREAFRQLAPEEQGVIGLRYREVSCDTQGNPGSSDGTPDSPQQPQQTSQQAPNWNDLLQKWTNQGSVHNSQQQPEPQQLPQPSADDSNSQGWWDDASKSWKNKPGMAWNNLLQKWTNQGSDSSQPDAGSGMQGASGSSWFPGKLLGQVARDFVNPGGWGN